jgi:HD-GYP domain-containing protein (c-di-GMP phosphodiesterase class II)
MLNFFSKEYETGKLLKRLTSIGFALAEERNLDKLLEMILLEAQQIADADGATLYIRNEKDALEYTLMKNDSLGIFVGGEGREKPTLKDVALYDKRTKNPNYRVQAVYAVLKGRSVNIADVYDAGGFEFSGTRKFDKANNYRTKSVLTIPMRSSKDHAIGCIQLVNAKRRGKTVPFSMGVVEVVQALASQAAIILDNKLLLEQEANLMEAIIKVIAKAIDEKSPHTGGHCQRVPVLTEMMAAAACDATEGQFEDFSLTDDEKQALHIAGWLHDCGKVTTPVHVIEKSTKLETIFDRIEIIKARYEIAEQEEKVRYLEALAAKGADKAKLKKAYEKEIKALQYELSFLEKINTGGEFLADEKVARIAAITKRRITQQGQRIPMLNEEEAYNLSVRKGTLNKEERQKMEDHMKLTMDMLESLPFPPHLKDVPEFALGHHEKMDGTGYPKGIPAGTMSWPARMMAVADVFEALTAADRPYKKPMKLSQSMEIIGRMKEDNHLDPEVVDFFVTSGVYKQYAKKFLTKEQRDTVDEAAILAVKPKPLKKKAKKSKK